MAIQGLDYWYDGQVRRFLEQIVRAFSGFQYKTGRREGEEPQLKMVPCRMDMRDRLIGHILRNNSENTLLSVPMITVALTSLVGSRDRVQSPTHVDTRLVNERFVDVNGEYTNASGNKYTVERLMPRPFELTVQVDVWTSNMDQKHQLMEQILTVIYPGFTIQNSENPLDWTARTDIMVEDVSWTSRSVPVNTEEIEVSTITLKMPFWLSPPAKVTHQKIVQQIVNNVTSGPIEEIVANYGDGGNRLGQQIVTPGNHHILVESGYITLLGPKAATVDQTGQPFSWSSLIQQYGVLRPTLSQIRLKLDPDIEETDSDIIGTIQFDATNPSRLLWTVDPDTLPANSFSPVNAVIDPRTSFPGNPLPAASSGQRYLLIHDVSPSLAWGNLTARENDIIEYQNGSWNIVFQASSTEGVRHVVNLHTGRQLRFSQGEWVLSIDGSYAPGYWRIHL